MGMSLGDLLVRVGADVSGFDKAMGDVSTRLKAVDRDVNKSIAGWDKLGNSLTSLGTTMTAAVTLPIAGVGVAATKMAADFELGMRKVTSLLDNATQQQFRSLSDATLELSKRIGVDAVKATEALYQAVSSGVPTDNAISFLEVASTAAIAGVTDTKVAVDGLTTVIQAFGLKTSDAKEIADAMFMAVNKGKLEFPELAASIGTAAGMAATLGVSYKELMAAGATLTNTTGQKVGEAMTMLEMSMKAVLDPTAQMTALLLKLGYSSGSALIAAKGLEGGIQAIVAAAGGSLETLTQAFGRVEGLRGALGLTGQNAKRAAEDLTAMNNSAGAATRAFEEIDKSTSRKFDRLTAEIKGTAIELGTALLPAVNSLLQASKPLTEMLGSVVKGFAGLPAPVQSTAIGLLAATAAIGPLVFGSGQLIGAFTALVKGAYSAAAAIGIFAGVNSIGAAAAALNNFTSVSIPAAIAGLKTFALTTIPQTVTAVAVLAEVMLRQAAASMLNFAKTAIPAAIAGMTTLVTSTIPAMVASFTAFSASTIPAATASLVNLARAGLASLTAAIPAVLTGLSTLAATVLPLIAVGALAAGAAFASWKLGEWAYNSIPAVKALGDTIAGLILMIPGLGSAIDWLTGVGRKQEQANADLDVATQKLEKSLAAKGITVDRVGKSTEQYAAALREAAKRAGESTDATNANDTAAKGAAKSTGTLAVAMKGLGLTSQAELKKAADQARAFYNEIVKAAKVGKATPEDVARAYAALKTATDALGVSTQKLSKEQVDAEKQWKKYQEAVALAKGKLVEHELATNDAIKTGQAWLDFLTTGLIPAFLTEATGIYQVDKANMDVARRMQETQKAGDALADSLKNQIPEWEFLKPAIESATDVLKGWQDTLSKSLLGPKAEINQLGEAFKTLRVTTVAELQAAADAAKQSYDKIIEDGTRAPYEIQQAWFEYLTAQRRVALATGGDWDAAMEKLYQKQKQTVEQMEGTWKAHGKKVKTFFQKMIEEVKQVFVGIGQSIGSGLFEILLGGDRRDYNKGLDEQVADLQKSLAERTAEWEKYQIDAAAALEGLRARHKAELEAEEADLQASLKERLADLEAYKAEQLVGLDEYTKENRKQLTEDLDQIARNLAERQAEYANYHTDIIQQMEDVRKELADNLAADLKEISDNLQERQQEYADYAAEVAQSEITIREDHARELKGRLDDLSRSLTEQKREYEKYVTDVNEKLSRIGEDYADSLDDETKAVSAKLADKKKDYTRDVEDINARIAEVQRKGGPGAAKEIADLKKSLKRKKEDYDEFVKETNDGFEEFKEDAKRRYDREENDLRASLKERNIEWATYQEENKRKADEAVTENQRTLNKELGDLQKNLAKKAAELEKYRLEAITKADSLVATYNTNLGKELGALEAADAKKLGELEKYRLGAAAKAEEITLKANAQLAKEEADVAKSIAKRQAEYDKYVVSITGPGGKLETLRAKHAQELAGEEADLAKSFNDRQAEYDKYVLEVTGPGGKLDKLREQHRTVLGDIGGMFENVFKRAGEALAAFVFGEAFEALWKKLAELAAKNGILGTIADKLADIFKPGNSTSKPSSGGGNQTSGGGGGNSGGGFTDSLAGAVGIFTGVYNMVFGSIMAAKDYQVQVFIANSLTHIWEMLAATWQMVDTRFILVGESLNALIKTFSSGGDIFQTISRIEAVLMDGRLYFLGEYFSSVTKAINDGVSRLIARLDAPVTSTGWPEILDWIYATLTASDQRLVGSESKLNDIKTYAQKLDPILGGINALNGFNDIWWVAMSRNYFGLLSEIKSSVISVEKQLLGASFDKQLGVLTEIRNILAAPRLAPAGVAMRMPVAPDYPITVRMDMDSQKVGDAIIRGARGRGMRF